MRAIGAFFLLIAFSLSAAGNELVDKKLAIEYLKISRFEQIIDATVDTYNQQLFKNLPAADREKAAEFMRETVGWEAVKDQLSELVINTYTKAELKAAIAFMKTPLGASYTVKSDAFSTRFATLLSNNFQKFLREHPIQPNPAVNPDAAQ